MSKYQHFDDLPVWQESARLYQKVLDLIEEANVPLTATFRNQLERAALSVSNNIAGSFDRMPISEMMSFLREARIGAAEVQSMLAVVSQRPKLARLSETLQQIRTLAESCGRQLGAWLGSLQNGPGRTRAPGHAGDEVQPAPAPAARPK